MIALGARQGTLSRVDADLLACFVFSDSELFRNRTAILKKAAGLPSSPFEGKSFTGEEQQTLLFYPHNFKARQLLLVGLGPSAKLTLERLRRAAAKAASIAVSAKAATLALYEPDPGGIAAAPFEDTSDRWVNMTVALAEGAVLSTYRFDKYVSERKTDGRGLHDVRIFSESDSRTRQIEVGVRLARVVCEATFLARDLQNAPGNEIFPESLAAEARRVGQTHGIGVTVLNERTIRRLRMGGLLGVAQGSARPPRFIILELNRPKAARGTVVLVGKGVTFDSGGISIKPAANMAEMKMDMSGAAAVIGTLRAAAELKIPIHIVGLIPATENLPGGRALKPGDILTHMNGKTSEIDNTDAEGRLILADALCYASRYKPDIVIDLATLTGACVVALGHVATGMLGNDDAMMEQLKAAGMRTYERVWELPMFDEYERLVKSDVADVKNVGGRWAGAITAAMFLRKFIGGYRWVHLDIAGTAILEEPLDYVPKGGSGVGVRLLIDFLRHWKKPR